MLRQRGAVATITPPAPQVRRARHASPWGAGTLAWGLAGFLFLLYAAVSLRQHAQFHTTGYDLGIFEQEVRSYATLRWPTSTLKGPGFPLLGDHFSPVTAVLAPAYALFPGPGTLLVAQAGLLAVAVVPLAGWAHHAVGTGAALATGFGLGLSWGIAQAVIFDFHEVAFAVPLLAFSLTALGTGRLRAAVAWAAPLVLVKEDLGLTLAVIGVLVAARGARRLGWTAAVGGVTATLVETLLVLPAVNPDGHNAYVGHLGLASVAQLPTVVTNGTKLATIALVVLPTGLLALRSPLALAALPTLAWRMLSDDPAYWGTAFHYSAVLMPVVFAAFVDVLARGPRAPVRRWAPTAAAVVTAACLAAPAPGLSSGLLQPAHPQFWTADAHVALGDEILAGIPDGVTVAASNSLVPHLTTRDDVSLVGLTPIAVSRPDYVVVDTAVQRQWPVDGDALGRLARAAVADGYRILRDEDGYLLLHAGA